MSDRGNNADLEELANAALENMIESAERAREARERYTSRLSSLTGDRDASEGPEDESPINWQLDSVRRSEESFEELRLFSPKNYRQGPFPFTVQICQELGLSVKGNVRKPGRIVQRDHILSRLRIKSEKTSTSTSGRTQSASNVIKTQDGRNVVRILEGIASASRRGCPSCVVGHLVDLTDYIVEIAGDMHAERSLPSDPLDEFEELFILMDLPVILRRIIKDYAFLAYDCKHQDPVLWKRYCGKVRTCKGLKEHYGYARVPSRIHKLDETRNSTIIIHSAVPVLDDLIDEQLRESPNLLQRTACILSLELIKHCLERHANYVVPTFADSDFITSLFYLLRDAHMAAQAMCLLEEGLVIRRKMYSLSNVCFLKEYLDNRDTLENATLCRLLGLIVHDQDLPMFNTDKGNMVLNQGSVTSTRSKNVRTADENVALLVKSRQFLTSLVSTIRLETIFQLQVIGCQHGTVASSEHISILIQDLCSNEMQLRWENGDQQLDVTEFTPRSLAAMRPPVYRKMRTVEVLHVLASISGSSMRPSVVEFLYREGFPCWMGALFKQMRWDDPTSLRSDHIHGPNCECSPEDGFRIQCMRLFHNYCEGLPGVHHKRRLWGNKRKDIETIEENLSILSCHRLLHAHKITLDEWCDANEVDLDTVEEDHAALYWPLIPEMNEDPGLLKHRAAGRREFTTFEERSLRSSWLQSSAQMWPSSLAKTFKKWEGTLPNGVEFFEFEGTSTLMDLSHLDMVEPTRGWHHKCTSNLMMSIIDRLIREPWDSKYVVWLASAVEAYIRGAPLADKIYIDSVLDLPKHLIAKLMKMYKDDPDSTEAEPIGPIQNIFDLLGELWRFNPWGLAMRQKDSRNLTGIIRRAMEDPVDSNLMIRYIILTNVDARINKNPYIDYDPMTCPYSQALVDNWKCLVKIFEAVSIDNMCTENICCINTSLLIYQLRDHHEACAMAWDFIVTDETRGCPALRTFQHVLPSWKLYYLRSSRDTESLRKGSRIPFKRWIAAVDEILALQPGVNGSPMRHSC
eukprot:Clim_evm20s203 gene=Clim_evmTU20s203